ncbi:MAG TPA: dTDP-4-dehydrorhamnose reductase [Candidatus Angelobacter sp.]|jgi:dTDP-4-dehydrorhamnose reductase|nr:dTDP-4-dehydrorhamnose reductase [Candidatus Angelobacter sp.]
MRVLVLGAGGQLGRELVQLGAIGLTRAECDIAQAGDAERALRQHRPDAVINCAAWTKVDAAETQRDEAFRANTQGPLLLAQACNDAGVLLTHISTDYVFDGTATAPIPETAPTSPLGVYGESKLEGEQAVRATAPRHQIVRTSWLYGQDGPNFVLTMLRLGAEREELRVVADQRGAPTWTGHLAPALLRLLEHATPGTYHLTSGGETTWCDFARAIMTSAALPARIEPTTTAEYAAPAPRPAYSVLENRAWQALGEPPLAQWEHGLAAYLASRRA